MWDDSPTLAEAEAEPWQSRLGVPLRPNLWDDPFSPWHDIVRRRSKSAPSPWMRGLGLKPWSGRTKVEQVEQTKVEQTKVEH